MSLDRWLGEFSSLRKEGPHGYGWAHHHDGGRHDTHMVFGSMVHGDEVGSLPAVVRIVRELTEGRRSFGGRATFFVGNPEAGRQGQRFLESDLNRVFMDEPPDTHEGRRAAELKPILDSADVFLDFHQTILETLHPFYIFPFQEHGWRWARAMGAAQMWVTRHPGQAFSTGNMCADEYVRVRGLPGITIELSEKGFGNGGEERTYAAIEAALALADAVHDGEVELADAAAARHELTFLHTTFRQRFELPSMALKPGIANFEPVREGEVLSAPGTPELRAPRDGMVLFPKYPPRDGRPLPSEIYRIVEPLPGHPLELYAS